MGSQWQSVNLPPTPLRRHITTPEEREANDAMLADYLARYDRGVELRAKRKERTTDAQRARKAAQDDTRKLWALLREAADAARWARIETALDGFMAFECRAKAEALRAKVEQRTRRLYERAAQGCEVSAAYLADESTDPLYAEAFQVVNGS